MSDVLIREREAQLEGPEAYERFLLDRYPYLATLQKAARLLPEGAVIVELGCWWGKATARFGMEWKPGQVIWAFDTFKGSDNWFEKPLFKEYIKMTKAKGFDSPEEYFKAYVGRKAIVGADIRLGVGEFDAAVKQFAPGTIDLLFVDGNHATTSHELVMWWPKVKPGGIVYCHDVDKQHWTVGEEMAIFCEAHGLDWDMDGELGWFRKGEANGGEC